MITKVDKVKYDWFVGEYGEEFTEFTVGEKGVTEITYHIPKHGGDKHFCDIEFEDGTTFRIFNLHSVEAKKKSNANN